MKITLQSFGRLKTAEVDLKPLTLFCGPNNTGKTYAMYGVYGLVKRIASPRLEFLEPLLADLNARGALEIDLEPLLEQHRADIVGRAASAFQKMLPRFFSAEPDLFAETKVSVAVPASDAALFRDRGKDYHQKSPDGKTVIQITKPAGSMTMSVTLSEKPAADLLRQILSDVMVEAAYGDWAGRVLLLPAERAGLNLFYRELNSRRAALLHHASQAEINPAELLRDIFVSRYPQPIADYIDLLNGMTQLKRDAGDRQDLAARLQKDVLSIKGYHIDRQGNVSFTPRRSDRKISLHLGSSVIKSLFGLWFFLEHLAAKGDVLMIDEPELNLHPENQRRLARLLARLVNLGVKVVLSTHSDYMIREFNNLLMMGSGKGQRRQRALDLHYDDGEALGSEQVAAYAFTDKGVERIAMDPDEGLLARTFDDVIERMNHANQEIFEAGFGHGA